MTTVDVGVVVGNVMDKALAYADRGWQVLPVHTVDEEGRCSCRKLECKCPGKHPRTWTGLSDATTDPEKIRGWWERWPDANIGIACRQSGFVAIDIDERHGGYERFQALVDEFGALPPTIEAQTGGGGSHLLFEDPGGEIKGGLALGVDLKSNGYIVVAPSVHQSGARYQWLPDQGPGEIALASLPEEWVELLRRGPSRREQSGSVADGRISDGTRHKSLASGGGSYRRHGFDGDDIAEVLTTINDRQCDPPLAQAEVDSIAFGMERYAPASGTFPFTDVGNAERLVARHGHELRSIANEWYVWETNRWVRDATGAAMRMTIETVRNIPREPVEASAIADLLSHALKSESSSMI